MSTFFVEAPVVHAGLPLPLAGRHPPAGGWILPDFHDRVVNAVRDGFSLAAICSQLDCDSGRVASSITRAVGHGFLTEAEARFYGRCREAA